MHWPYTWQQLHHWSSLPGLSKVVLAASITVVILSVFIRPAGGVSAKAPLCVPDQTPEAEDWRPPTEPVWREFGTDRCSIERVSVLELSPERFESEYQFKKPVIVTFPHGAVDWTRPGNWSKRGLLENYRDWVIRLGRSVDIISNGGVASTYKASLYDYVNYLLMEDRPDNDKSEPSNYVADHEFFWKSRLHASLRLPPYFKVNRSSDDSIFLLGPALSGLAMHRHVDAWNGVVHGYKRWFLYPTTGSPPGGIASGYSILNWIKHVYPNLTEREKPVECVQYPGEIIYLPEGIYHATLNLGDTVAISIQKKKTTIKSELLSRKAEVLMNELRIQRPSALSSLHLELLEVCREWHQLLPGSSETVIKLAGALADMQDLHQALHWLKKAIEMDRYFIAAYCFKGQILSTLGQYSEAEAAFLTAIQLSPDLREANVDYGDFLLKRGRHRDALPFFKKGTELRPDDIQAWSSYQLCQRSTGDLGGAAATERIIQQIRERKKE